MPERIGPAVRQLIPGVRYALTHLLFHLPQTFRLDVLVIPASHE